MAVVFANGLHEDAIVHARFYDGVFFCRLGDVSWCVVVGCLGWEEEKNCCDIVCVCCVCVCACVVGIDLYLF